MRTTVLRWCATIAVIVLAASCSGGGGGDRDFVFGGRWLMDLIVTDSNVPANPVGTRGPDVLIIDQRGNAVTVWFESTGGDLVLNGPCDGNARTFTATGVGTGRYFGSSATISGAGIDYDSMSGTFRFTFPAGRFTAGTWVADLGSRAVLGAGAAGAGAGVHNLILSAVQ
ncbi:MAG TPA: hypothetical protein VN317_10505 [Candidatus Methanoperedens sp.]|nr:hypothetical protein [Candidatus Methanoperedens sp.]